MSDILPKAVFCGLIMLSLPASAAERVNVATPLHGLSELPIVVAMRNRYFATEGLEIQKIQIKPQIAVKALLGAEVDFNLAWDASVKAAISGAPIKVIAAIAARPLDILMVRPEIRSGKDLRGKTLGVEGFLGAADDLARLALRYLGVEAGREVHMVELGSDTLLLNALRTGSIHGAVLNPATAARAEEEGFKRLVQLSDIIDLPVLGVAVTAKKLSAEREQIRRFIQATLRGARFIKQNRTDTLRMIQRYLELTPSQAARAYDAAVGALTEDGLISDRALALSIRRAREGLPIAVDPKLNQAADWSVLREVLADRRKVPFWLKRYDP